MMSSSEHKYTSAHWGSYRICQGQDKGRAIELQSLSGDAEPSPFGQSMIESVSSDARILRPAVRVGYLQDGPRRDVPRGDQPFVEVSWNEAIDLATNALTDVYQRFGPASVFGGSYGWASAGRFHHALGQLHRFLNCLGGYTGSVNTYSHAAAEVLLPHVVGEEDDIIYNGSTWPTIVENTQLMLCFGGLPIISSQINPGGVSKHNVRDWLRQCAGRGIKRINISPLNDQVRDDPHSRWWQARPNTDTAIMMGIAKALIDADLHDKTFLGKYTVGFDKFRSYLSGEVDGIVKSPEWAAKISGLGSSDIRELAKEIAGKRTLLTAAWSLQRADHGEQPFWMLVTLAAMIGQIGLPGGGFAFGLTSMNGIANPVTRRRFASLPQGKNPVSTKIPVARITDLLLSPNEEFDYDGKKQNYPDIRLVYWAGGNPFHHHQDLVRLRQAWRQPETIICNELHWNSLARHSDIVLPAVAPLERNDIMATKSDSRIIAMRQACRPPGDARTDYEIFSAMADSLGVAQEFTESRSEQDWLRWLYDSSTEAFIRDGLTPPAFDEFWSQGMWQQSPDDVNRVLLEEFRQNPEVHKLCTPTGRIEIFSERISSFNYNDCPGHPVWIEPREWLGAAEKLTTSLHLISDQPRTRLHSQLDDVGISKSSKVNHREPAELNSLDAQERGIKDGDTVRIYNHRGALLAGAVLTRKVSRGVVHLSTGAWFDPVVNDTDGFTTCVHGNPNILTGDYGTSKLSQGPSPLSTLVEIEKYTGNLRKPVVHGKPEFVKNPKQVASGLVKT
jgi:biotin/methionine sulfoxide reductase